MPTVYPSLHIPARDRLAMFRAEATRPTWARPMTWRDVRFADLRSATGLEQGSNNKTPVWYTQGNPPFARERFADEVARLDHQGWFTDGEDCSETARGIVVSLPHGRYLAGYLLSMNDERVYFADVFDNEKDAARMADEHARVIGEQESEHARRWQEAYDIESKIENIEESIRAARLDHSAHIVAKAREVGNRHGRAAYSIREQVREQCEELRELRHELSAYSDVL